FVARLAQYTSRYTRLVHAKAPVYGCELLKTAVALTRCRSDGGHVFRFETSPDHRHNGRPDARSAAPAPRLSRRPPWWHALTCGAATIVRSDAGQPIRREMGWTPSTNA